MADATAETATETTETTTTTETATESETDWQAEAEKWKGLARKNEDRAKDNARKAKELDELHKAQMSDTERAIAETRDKAFAEGRAAGVSATVAAEVRAAAKGRIAEPDALLDGLDASKFVTETGDVDTELIAAWVDRIAPVVTEEQTGPLAGIDLGQGTRQVTPIGDDKTFERVLRNVVGAPKK